MADAASPSPPQLAPPRLPAWRSRLAVAVMGIGERMRLPDLACVQVWIPAALQPGAGVDALQRVLFADPGPAILGCAALSPFLESSRQCSQLGHQGMPGRVLRSGCVQVVQNLHIIPGVLHPRCRLTDAAAAAVGEMVYVPVFDLHAPAAGPVAVLEALLSSHASDSMLVASFISAAGRALAASQLSLSNPLPQPVGRSRLEGRKPRPVHNDSEPDLCEQQQPHPHSVAGPAGTPTVQAPAAAAAAVAVPCCSPVPAAGPFAAPEQQQQQQCSPSSASAGTVVATGALGASSPSATATDSTLTSTLSSQPGEVPAAMPAELLGGLCCQPGAMLPPRPLHAAGRPPHQQQQHRRAREDGGTPAAAVFGHGSGDDDDDASPPPHKLRRTLSMSRTKSVSGGLDLVLAAAVAACEHAAAC